MSGVNTIGQRGVEGIVGDKKISRLSDMAIRAKSAEGANTMHRRLSDAVRSGVANRAMFIALSVPALQGCLPDPLTDAELNAKIAAAQCEADGGGMIKGDCYIPGLGDIAGSDGSGNDGITRRGGDTAFVADTNDGGSDADDIVAMDSADTVDSDDADDDSDGKDGDDSEETTDVGPVIIDINIGNDADVAADGEEDIGLDADDAIDVDPADIVEIGDDAEVDIGLDADDNGATDVVDGPEADAADNGATDVADDVEIDAIADSATDADDATDVDPTDLVEIPDNGGLDADDVGVDAITDSVTDAGVDGATDASGDLTDVNPADMAGDVTGSDGFIDSDGDGVLDSSGDVGADSTDGSTDSGDTGSDADASQPPKMCEGQPHGQFKPFYTGKPGTQGVGDCATGVFQCDDGTWINIFNEVVPVEEGKVCDGKDNDCDGLTDETEVAVGSAIGECKQKIEGCVNGQWGTKSPAGLPKAETCDNKDNDCDGKTDEDGKGMPLEQTVPVSPSDGIGICKSQDEVCYAGNWKVVKAGVGPKPKEIYMNGLDDNCNGKTDIEDPNGTCDGNNDGLVDTEKFDPGFLSAVLKSLGKAPGYKLTQAEVETTTSLNLSGKNLNDISGLECFQNLTNIDLSNNNLSGGVPPLQIILTLANVFLDNNPNLADLTALIENPGFGAGDKLSVKKTAAAGTQVNQIKAKGVTVISEYGN